MNRKLVGQKLKALREPRFPERSDLTKATGLKYAQIQNAEDGHVFPRLDLLQKWLEACGTTLSQFFEELESELDAAKSKPDIIPGFEEYYQNLNRILRSGSRYYRQGIESNLKALANSAEEDTKTNKIDEGNIRPKEKKKRVDRKAS